jgi:hypothetical protein
MPSARPIDNVATVQLQNENCVLHIGHGVVLHVYSLFSFVSLEMMQEFDHVHVSVLPFG